jgi:hypothetical protein
MIALVAPDDKLEAFFDRVARLSDAVSSRRVAVSIRQVSVQLVECGGAGYAPDGRYR